MIAKRARLICWTSLRWASCEIITVTLDMPDRPPSTLKTRRWKPEPPFMISEDMSTARIGIVLLIFAFLEGLHPTIIVNPPGNL